MQTKKNALCLTVLNSIYTVTRLQRNCNGQVFGVVVRRNARARVRRRDNEYLRQGTPLHRRELHRHHRPLFGPQVKLRTPGEILIRLACEKKTKKNSLTVRTTGSSLFFLFFFRTRLLIVCVFMKKKCVKNGDLTQSKGSLSSNKISVMDSFQTTTTPLVIGSDFLLYYTILY